MDESQDVRTADRYWAAAAHISPVWVAVAIVTLERRPVFWAPMLAFLGPLALLPVHHRGSQFVLANVKRVLAFALSLTVYTGVAAGAIIVGLVWSPARVLIFFALLALFVLALNWIIFAVIGARRALRGEVFDYPIVLDLARRVVRL